MDVEPPKSDPKAWGEYFARKLELQRAAEAAADDAEEALEIIQPSRPAVYDDLNTSVKNLLSRMMVAGFWAAVQVTVVRQIGTVFKTGDRAGEMRPDREISNAFIHAANADGRTLTVWYRDGKMENAQTRDNKILDRMSDVEAYLD